MAKLAGRIGQEEERHTDRVAERNLDLVEAGHNLDLGEAGHNPGLVGERHTDREAALHNGSGDLGRNLDVEEVGRILADAAAELRIDLEEDRSPAEGDSPEAGVL